MAAHTRFTDSTPTGRFGDEETDLAERLLRLNDASLRVAGTLESGNVLQEVADSACALTEARYGVMALFDQSGGVQETVTSGLDSQQLSRVMTPPVGEGLLGYLNELEGTLRVADISKHFRSVGFPEYHPMMRTFLGVQVRHDGVHLGNIYLGEKVDGGEFTELDEEIITRFAAQAGAAISNSRKFERERKIKTDLRALVKIAPVGLLVFDARTGAVLTSNSVVALGELAQSLNETEPLQLLQIIDHQAEVMRNQINSLIELSHIEAGRLSLSLEPTDPSTLISDSVREFKRNHAGFTVSQRIPVDSPRIMVDKERVSQALRDMFAHAVKYASAESTISVNAEPEDFRVKISVSIANDRSNASETPELLECIRSAAEEDAKQSFEGDRLALTICKGIVEAHGGRFQAERGDCGRGITFTFTVPLAEDLYLNNGQRDDGESTGAPTGYAFRSVAIDFDSHSVALDGQPIHLTATEYNLLCELSKNAGRVVTQDDLLLEVWGSEYRGESQLLRAYVKTLRQKLGDNARNPTYIFTERGVGYRMAKG